MTPTANREATPWERTFRRWLEAAEATGRDPNDVGDDEWQGAALPGVQRFYLPYIDAASVVLELGPGTGRYTRHIIGHCRHMILADYSPVACEWLPHYLDGKGQFEVHHLPAPQLDMIADASVDFAFANGVFEHLDIEDVSHFLEEFQRVLRPEAALVFNFNNIMSPAAVTHLRRQRGKPGQKCLFRYYHPETIRQLATSVGFRSVMLNRDETRFAFIECRKVPAEHADTPAGLSHG